MHSNALVPNLILNSENKALANISSILGGVLLISLLAQIAIPLPWTPVPITGQTFGVTLVSLLWGWKRGSAVMGTYLLLGGLGLPIFASATSSLLVGPTLGYLVGMFFASCVVGYLADIGFTKTFAKSLIASYCGSAVVFTCGLIGLSYFVVDSSLLLSLGLLPFLVGDLIKNTLASLIATKISSI